jgi:HEAT repeat protein
MKKRSNKKAASRKSVKGSSARGAKQTALSNLELAEGAQGLRQALTILADKAESEDRRSAALQTLQAASFGVTDFEGVRSDYIAVLRDMTADPNVELRQRAFGLLSRSGDAYAEKTLVDGLKDEKKALVPPSDALSYLSYNPHSGVQSLARSLFESSKDKETRVQALRVMAGDPSP